MIDYEALAQRLADKVPALTIGKNVVIDTMPISVSKGVILRSNITGEKIDYELPGFAKTTFRLIVRCAKYGEGKDLLYASIEALMVERPTQIGNMRVRFCRPRSSPVIFPFSEGNLREFMVKMEICYDFEAEKCPWLKTLE